MSFNDENILVFHHIQKTGGTTLRKALARNVYAKGDFFSYYSHEEQQAFEAMPDVDKNRLKLIIGHHPFGLHKLFNRSAKYFSIVREPIDRLVSFYYYMRQPSFIDDLGPKRMSLEEFLVSGLIADFDNGLVRHFSGIPNIPYGECTDEHLEIAKENINEYYPVVGMLKYFDESLLLMRKAFNWSIPFYVRENTTSGRMFKNNLSYSTMETLKKNTELDTQLFNWISEKFKNQLSDYENLENEKEIFKKLNILNTLVDDVKIHDLFAEACDLFQKNLYEDVYSCVIRLQEHVKNVGASLACARNLNTRLLYKCGSALKQLGEYPEAEKVFMRALDNTKDTALLSGIYFHLGESTFFQNKNNSALEYFQLCLNFNPLHVKAKVYCEKINEQYVS